MTKTFSLFRFVSMIDILSWSDLTYSYDETNQLSFPDGQVKKGELVAVIGSSGSGKSTWIQLLSGILPLQNGHVRIHQDDLRGAGRKKRDAIRARHLGIVFQKNHFLEYLTIADNLSLPSFAGQVHYDQDFVSSLCEKLGVDHLLNKRPKECSIGELQRLSIIRTVSTRPSFILADEPTSALDDKNAKTIMDVFKELRDALNMGVIIVTHDQRVKNEVENVISFEA